MGPAPLSYPGVRTLELRERAARRRLFHVMDLMRQEFETASWVPFPAILERASPRWRNVYALRREQLDMVRKKLETKRLETGSQD